MYRGNESTQHAIIFLGGCLPRGRVFGVGEVAPEVQDPLAMAHPPNHRLEPRHRHATRGNPATACRYRAKPRHWGERGSPSARNALCAERPSANARPTLGAHLRREVNTGVVLSRNDHHHTYHLPLHTEHLDTVSLRADSHHDISPLNVPLPTVLRVPEVQGLQEEMETHHPETATTVPIGAITATALL